MRAAEHFGVRSDVLREALRLDASFYNPRVADALAALDRSGMEIVNLGGIVDRVFIPGRTKRTYVGPTHGVPFLQGGHIVQFRPADVRYVSRTAQKKLEDWIIRAGWILVTRSGTVGRVAVAPTPWDGWAVSEHVLRIIPKARSSVPSGYLAAFLGSPIGQAQLKAQIYGAVVDELTEEQTRSVRVPVPRDADQRRQVREIADFASRATNLRAQALELSQRAEAGVSAFLPNMQHGDGSVVEHFAVGSDLIGDALRFDASFYNPRVADALRVLRQSGMKMKALGDVAERIYIPPRFKRIYVDREHGVPFLQGSHVPQFRPDDVRYLSKSAHKRLARWIIRAGWILVTCSGTIGRVTIAPKQWDQWAASQHILRIVPREDADCPSGYLAAFLASPYGQAQLTAQIYGAVVDELTEEQTRSVRVPVPRTKAQRQGMGAINDLALQAVRLWTEAVHWTDRAEAALAALVPQEPTRRTLGRDDRVKIDLDPEDALGVLLRTPRA